MISLIHGKYATKGSIMAKRVTVDLVDDFDPEQIADETVNFGLDDISYEIDLSSNNAKALRADLQKWVDVARRESGRARRPRTNSASAQSGLPLAEVRKWAREHGHSVSTKGRVSAEVVRAWKARDENPDPEKKAPAKKAPAKKAAQSPITGESILNGAVDAAKNDPEFSGK